MKLVRYGVFGEEKPGLFDKAGQLRDLSSAIGDLRGSNLNRSNLTALSKCDETSFPIVKGRPSKLDDEIAFLKGEIYLRDVEPRLQTLTAFDRFSVRA